MSGSAEALTLLSRNGQPSYTYGAGNFSGFNALVDAKFSTVTSVNAIASLAQLQAADGVLLNSDYGNTLSASEQSFLSSYISDGGKVVVAAKMCRLRLRRC